MYILTLALKTVLLFCRYCDIITTLAAHSWRSPEDAFYWDPVFATVLLKHGAHDTLSVMSLLTSPRALTPAYSDTYRTDAETGRQVHGRTRVFLNSNYKLILE